MLRPADVVVCLYTALAETTSYASMAAGLQMSQATVHRSVKRARDAKLLRITKRSSSISPIPANLLEFLKHGVRFVFYPERGAISRGVPTGAAAPGFADRLLSNAENSPVWPSPRGRARGYTLEPLAASVPDIVTDNVPLYTALGAVDLIRIGSARERLVAGDVLEGLLS